MKKKALLVVDDEDFNREVLDLYLSEAGYEVVQAADGEQAWEILQQRTDFSVILLDRVMPMLDGLGLLKRIKADKHLRYIPVILQTIADSSQDITEGMQAGAFYYLTKPYSRDVLLTTVQSAVRDHVLLEELHGEWIHQGQDEPLQRYEFRIHTFKEAQRLADTLARFFPDPQRALLGLSELMVNAVEHGNLGIHYSEKSALLQSGTWEAEIQRRLALPENAGKLVHVLLERLPREMRLIVTDCGDGFDWKKYMELSPERAFDPNGRGIAMSKMISFDSLKYHDKGNQVVATVRLPES